MQDTLPSFCAHGDPVPNGRSESERQRWLEQVTMIEEWLAVLDLKTHPMNEKKCSMAAVQRYPFLTDPLSQVQTMNRSRVADSLISDLCLPDCS